MELSNLNLRELNQNELENLNGGFILMAIGIAAGVVAAAAAVVAVGLEVVERIGYAEGKGV